MISSVESTVNDEDIKQEVRDILAKVNSELKSTIKNLQKLFILMLKKKNGLRKSSFKNIFTY